MTLGYVPALVSATGSRKRLKFDAARRGYYHLAEDHYLFGGAVLDAVKGLSIAQLVWYLVPGVALLLFGLTYTAGLSPAVAEHIVTTCGSAGLFVISCILGCVLDGLRLYRMRPNYTKEKRAFFDKIKKLLGDDVDPYYVLPLVQDLARSWNRRGFELDHALWIMLGQLTFICWVSCVAWMALVARVYLATRPTWLVFSIPLGPVRAGLVYFAMALVSGVLGLRLLFSSLEEQQKVNRLYQAFVEFHREQILETLRGGSLVGVSETTSSRSR